MKKLILFALVIAMSQLTYAQVPTTVNTAESSVEGMHEDDGVLTPSSKCDKRARMRARHEATKAKHANIRTIKHNRKGNRKAWKADQKHKVKRAKAIRKHQNSQKTKVTAIKTSTHNANARKYHKRGTQKTNIIAPSQDK